MVGLVPTTHEHRLTRLGAAPPRLCLRHPVFMGGRDKPEDDDQGV